MIIAIIDSGINQGIFKGYNIGQYCAQSGLLTGEVLEDRTGHGT